MRIIACLAASLDGRIGSATNLKDRIGTPADLEHLLTVRNQADAILCGGETFRQHAAIRKGNRQERPPLQVILTQRFQLPPEAKLFQQSQVSTPPVPLLPVPILIVSPQQAPAEIRNQYPNHVEWLATGDGNPVPTILKALTDKGIQTLMVEGGGHIMNLFLQAQAIDELYLTVCPLLLGGQSDPSLVTGLGFPVAQAPRTEVIQAEWRGQELYLHLKLQYPKPA